MCASAPANGEAALLAQIHPYKCIIHTARTSIALLAHSPKEHLWPQKPTVENGTKRLDAFINVSEMCLRRFNLNHSRRWIFAKATCTFENSVSKQSDCYRTNGGQLVLYKRVNHHSLIVWEIGGVAASPPYQCDRFGQVESSQMVLRLNRRGLIASWCR